MNNRVAIIKFLSEKGFDGQDVVEINGLYAEKYSDIHPFIDVKNIMEDGKQKHYYHSTHKDIKSFMFETENEAVLANAIFINLGDKFEANTFTQLIKFTFRMIGIESRWCK